MDPRGRVGRTTDLKIIRFTVPGSWGTFGINPATDLEGDSGITYCGRMADSSSRRSLADRLLIIGWDGADWEILDDLMRRGHLPNLAALSKEGIRGELASTIPSHSWAAWSTFLTGMNPGRHGVFDFVEIDPTNPQMRTPIGSQSIKLPTFVEYLSASGNEVRMGNVPVTFPPFAVRGRLISGVAIPPGSPYVYPDAWSKEVNRRAPFPTNGMEWTRFQDDPRALLAEARDFIEQRTASFELMLEGDWSVATCVYLSPDRLQHPFAKYLIPSHPEYGVCSESTLADSLRDVYELLDRQIERLRGAAGPDVTTLVMSDHGFRAVTHRVNPNLLLAELGLQAQSRAADAKAAILTSSLVRRVRTTRLGRWVKQRVRAPSLLDWGKSIAYQSGTGFGISVNLKGREPQGIVEPADHGRIREEIRDALLSFRDLQTNSSPVGNVWRREELYAGPYMELAPDLIIEWNELWDYQNEGDLTMRVDWPSGDHRRNGILVACGSRISAGSVGVRDIADLAATALAFCGVMPRNLDGRPIDAIVGPVSELAEVSPPPLKRLGDAGLSLDEQESIAHHLRDLGYIE